MNRNTYQLVALRLNNKDLSNLLQMGFTPDDYLWVQKLRRVAPDIFKFIDLRSDDFLAIYRDFIQYTFSVLKSRKMMKRLTMALQTSFRDYSILNTLPVLKYITSLNPSDLESYANIHTIVEHAIMIKSEDIFKWSIDFPHNINFIIAKLLYEGTFNMIQIYYEKYPDKFTSIFYDQNDTDAGSDTDDSESDSNNDAGSDTESPSYYNADKYAFEAALVNNYLSNVVEREDAIPILEFIYTKTTSLPSKSLYRNISIKIANTKTYLWLLEHGVVPEDGRINYALQNFPDLNFARFLIAKYHERPTSSVFTFLYHKIDIELLDFLATVIDPPLLPEQIRNYFSPKITEDDKITLLEWAYHHEVAIDPKIFYAVLLNYDTRGESKLLNWFLTHGYTLDQNLLDVILSQSSTWRFPPNLYTPTLNALILAFNHENYRILSEMKKLYPKMYTAFLKLIPTNDPVFFYFDKFGDPRKRKVPLQGYKPKDIPLQEFPDSPLLKYLKSRMFTSDVTKWSIREDKNFR